MHKKQCTKSNAQEAMHKKQCFKAWFILQLTQTRLNIHRNINKVPKTFYKRRKFTCELAHSGIKCSTPLLLFSSSSCAICWSLCVFFILNLMLSVECNICLVSWCTFLLTRVLTGKLLYSPFKCSGTLGWSTVRANNWFLPDINFAAASAPDRNWEDSD